MSLSNFWVISNYFVTQIFPSYIFMKMFRKKKVFTYKIFFNVLRSGKWRLFWSRLGTKTKLRIKHSLNSVCLICLRFELYIFIYIYTHIYIYIYIYIYSRVWITLNMFLCNSEFHAREIFRHSRSYIIFLLPKSKKRKHKISINNTQY